MSACNKFFVISIMAISSVRVSGTIFCGEGQMVYKEQCIECKLGISYMDEKSHQKKFCRSCATVNNPNVERLISSCTLTRDAVIGCRDGYFRINATNVDEPGQCRMCQQCSEGEHKVQSCQGYTDTVCCKGENYKASPEGSCVKKPTYCGQGEYLDLSSGECMPCGEGTFMPDEKHRHSKCYQCTKADDYVPEEIVLEKCTRTKDTVLGCKEGYFWRYSREIFRGECIICTNCAFEPVKNFTGQKCTMFSDTICCRHPYTMVRDDNCTYPTANFTQSSGTDQDVNKSLSTTPPRMDKNTCGRNEFLSSSGGNSCTPCPPGTVRLQYNHTYDFCENYTRCSRCGNEIAVIIVLSIGFVIVILVIVYALWKYMQCHGKKRAEYHPARQREETSV